MSNIWKDAVYDRNQTDIDHLIELAGIGYSNLSTSQKLEWDSGLKGAFNLSDYSRIVNNVNLLSEVLDLGITISVPSINRIPKAADFASMLSAVSAIRNAYAIHSDTPAVPDAPINTFTKLNDIEKILSDVYGILMNNFHYYAGSEIYAGDEFGLLL